VHKTGAAEFSPSFKFVFHLASTLNMSLRPSKKSSKSSKREANGDGSASRHEEHSHDHSNGGADSHSHSLFGSHSHGEESNIEEHEKIMQALQGGGDRGSRITLIGLFGNVALTLAKGIAGWYMHSASLLADAGHSLSDLLCDFVVLFCWKLSRRPPSQRYPYGFAKFESLGTTTVSLLLLSGGIGIGIHSYRVLVDATQTLNLFQNSLHNTTSPAQQVHISAFHDHSHEIDVLDPNAAWIAAIGILAKEWLYRITKKVADEENSPVLLANAIHHRSDVYSTIVALFAILGSWWFPALPLDPIGGLLVSIVILQQGCSLFAGAFGDLTDAGISTHTHSALTRILEPLTAFQGPSSPRSSPPSPPPSPTQSQPSLLAIRHLRAKRAGSLMFVDLTADVTSSLSVRETSALEETITNTLKKTRREIAEVRVQFHPVDDAVI